MIDIILSIFLMDNHWFGNAIPENTREFFNVCVKILGIKSEKLKVNGKR